MERLSFFPISTTIEDDTLTVAGHSLASLADRLSMSSNYNGARLPAVMWLEERYARLIQHRETTDDLLRRDDEI
jgi:hypothetical protein